MGSCQSCGGVIGRDCFNPVECAMISASEDSRKDYEIIKLRETVKRIIEILDAHGINVDELKPKTIPVPETMSFTYGPEDLPF